MRFVFLSLDLPTQSAQPQGMLPVCTEVCEGEPWGFFLCRLGLAGTLVVLPRA